MTAIDGNPELWGPVQDGHAHGPTILVDHEDVVYAAYLSWTDDQGISVCLSVPDEAIPHQPARELALGILTLLEIPPPSV